MSIIWSFDPGKVAIDAIVIQPAPELPYVRNKKAKPKLRFFEKLTLLNRCIRVADRETVCVI